MAHDPPAHEPQSPEHEVPQYRDISATRLFVLGFAAIVLLMVITTGIQTFYHWEVNRRTQANQYNQPNALFNTYEDEQAPLLQRSGEYEDHQGDVFRAMPIDQAIEQIVAEHQQPGND
jgi:hypothetical protein